MMFPIQTIQSQVLVHVPPQVDGIKGLLDEKKSWNKWDRPRGLWVDSL